MTVTVNRNDIELREVTFYHTYEGGDPVWEARFEGRLSTGEMVVTDSVVAGTPELALHGLEEKLESFGWEVRF